MANIIAIIWDCDNTLIDGCMQDPIFEHYNVNGPEFWRSVDALPPKYAEEGVKVNPETIYLNQFIRYAKNGTFQGLNNAKLREFGKQQKYFPGIPEIFKATKELVENDKSYADFGIRVEHYIVSTGFAEIIRGSELMDYVDEVWGCEMIETEDASGEKVIGEVGYTIDNTTKTRAIFEINKGIPKNKDIDVNSKIPEVNRRVHFTNMIYIADGPSDIPAFSVVNKNGGSTFAIYPKGDLKRFKQVDKMRSDGRVNMYAEADYSQGTTAYMWIMNRVKELADEIRNKEKSKIMASVSKSPRHMSY